jgi:DNA-directed RNA polymerase subunit RPC12/RpoP
VTDTVKCACSHCGAKYRLPAEAQGRHARCKKCGEKFLVPRELDLEDSILSWLNEPDDQEEALERPRVISMPTDSSETGAARRSKAIIRTKTPSSDDSSA